MNLSDIDSIALASYVKTRIKELSSYINDGVIKDSPLLDELITQGNSIITLFFNSSGYVNNVLGLSGSAQVLDENTSPTVVSTANSTIDIPVLIRGSSWSNDVCREALDSENPINTLGDMIAKWYNDRELVELYYILKGLFITVSSPLGITHCYDISSNTGAASQINVNFLFDIKQFLGDVSQSLTAIAMHSATFTTLQKQGSLSYITNLFNVIPLQNNNFSPSTGIYNTFFFGDGCIRRGRDISVEISEDNILTVKFSLCLYPLGVSWTGTTVTSPTTPSGTDLSLPANWLKKMNNKSIQMVSLRHKLP
jgi:hypothetical protein